MQLNFAINLRRYHTHTRTLWVAHEPFTKNRMVGNILKMSALHENGLSTQIVNYKLFADEFRYIACLRTRNKKMIYKLFTHIWEFMNFWANKTREKKEIKKNRRFYSHLQKKALWWRMKTTKKKVYGHGRESEC